MGRDHLKNVWAVPSGKNVTLPNPADLTSCHIISVALPTWQEGSNDLSQTQFRAPFVILFWRFKVSFFGHTDVVLFLCRCVRFSFCEIKKRRPATSRTASGWVTPVAHAPNGSRNSSDVWFCEYIVKEKSLHDSVLNAFLFLTVIIDLRLSELLVSTTISSYIQLIFELKIWDKYFNKWTTPCGREWMNCASSTSVFCWWRET